MSFYLFIYFNIHTWKSLIFSCRLIMEIYDVTWWCSQRSEVWFRPTPKDLKTTVHVSLFPLIHSHSPGVSFYLLLSNAYPHSLLALHLYSLTHVRLSGSKPRSYQPFYLQLQYLYTCRLHHPSVAILWLLSFPLHVGPLRRFSLGLSLKVKIAHATCYNSLNICTW